METIWFVLVAVMVAMYVLLDGFDLGAGALTILVVVHVSDTGSYKAPVPSTSVPLKPPQIIIFEPVHTAV